MRDITKNNERFDMLKMEPIATKNHAHTPGPWYIAIDDFDADDRDAYIIRDKNNSPVALVARAKDRGIENAWLISAAPLLLSGLCFYHDREWIVPHDGLPAHKSGELLDECPGCYAVLRAERGI